MRAGCFGGPQNGADVYGIVDLMKHDEQWFRFEACRQSLFRRLGPARFGGRET